MTTLDKIRNHELIDEIERVVKIFKTQILDNTHGDEIVDFNSHLTNLPLVFNLYLQYSYNPKDIAIAYAEEMMDEIDY